MVETNPLQASATDSEPTPSESHADRPKFKNSTGSRNNVGVSMPLTHFRPTCLLQLKSAVRIRRRRVLPKRCWLGGGGGIEDGNGEFQESDVILAWRVIGATTWE